MSSLSAFGWLQSSLGIDITGEWSGLVSLNVGGVTFSCHRKTFKSFADASVLCKMALSTDRNVPRSEDGSVILDRDPETFRHVLNFLRGNGQKLLLPDNFDEWDLLLDDARVYELPKLAEAIRAHPRYQQRCFVDSLPSGVMLRWVEGSTSSSSSSSNNISENAFSPQKIELFPPLQSLEVTEEKVVSEGGDHHEEGKVSQSCSKMTFQGRNVSFVDEAVAILLTTYQMKVDVWHRDAVSGSNEQRLAHTVFLTKKK